MSATGVPSMDIPFRRESVVMTWRLSYATILLLPWSFLWTSFPDDPHSAYQHVLLSSLSLRGSDILFFYLSSYLLTSVSCLFWNFMRSAHLLLWVLQILNTVQYFVRRIPPMENSPTWWKCTGTHSRPLLLVRITLFYRRGRVPIVTTNYFSCWQKNLQWLVDTYAQLWRSWPWSE